MRSASGNEELRSGGGSELSREGEGEDFSAARSERENNAQANMLIAIDRHGRR